MLNRRAMMGLVAALANAPAFAARSAFSQAVQELERAQGGRLGAAMFTPATGLLVGWRSTQRFAMCSTFKLPLAAAIMSASERGLLAMDEPIALTPADIVPHAPVTGPIARASGSMSVRELVEAAQLTSDNVAANMLIKRLGGLGAFNRQFVDWGDKVTRLDRLEPEMNRVVPNDPRDTTTPAAMARQVAHFMLDNALSPALQAQLVDLTRRTQTGLRRIRAGIPAGWVVGDKTGTAMGPTYDNKVNDVAIVWPQGGHPYVLAAYYEGPRRTDEIHPADEAVLASVGRISALAAQGR